MSRRLPSLDRIATKAPQVVRAVASVVHWFMRRIFDTYYHILQHSIIYVYHIGVV